MSPILIGAGGHAKVVLDIAKLIGMKVRLFVDPNIAEFEELKRVHHEEFKDCLMGIGGVDPDHLEKRHSVYLNCKQNGSQFLSVISPFSAVSENTKLGEGIFINHGAVIQTNTNFANNVIVNSRAIIEHDVVIGEGSHIAPGAIVLGGVNVGRFCMIGAGSVVLPGSVLNDKTLVPALTRYKND